MPANEIYCAQLVQFFDQFPNWSFVSQETKLNMIAFLSRTARDDHEAHAAVQDLMENQNTGKVPTISELRQWIEAQRDDEYKPPQRSGKPACQHCVDGMAFRDGVKFADVVNGNSGGMISCPYCSGHPPSGEKPGCGYQNANAMHPDGGPTRCEDGWIFVVKRVIVKGRTEAEDYTYAGKCPRCHGTAWYAQQEGK